MTETEGSCGICREAYASNEGKRSLPCSHAFHADCLVGWFLQGNVSCPYCRYRFGQASSESAISETSQDVTDVPHHVALLDTPEEPYWTKIFRPGYHIISSREVVTWVFSKMKAFSKKASAPAALKRRFDLKQKCEDALKAAKKALREFPTIEGTWQVLQKKRRRIMATLRRVMQADSQALFAAVKFCQDTPHVKRYLLETKRPIPRPPWWGESFRNSL